MTDAISWERETSAAWLASTSTTVAP